MKELITFLKYFLVSNFFILFIISCDSSSPEIANIENISPQEIPAGYHSGPMSKEDSIVQLARDLNIEFDENKDNINIILEKILISKQNLISKLDSLDVRADEMEILAYKLKKKENAAIRRGLLNEISHIKAELERIKKLTGNPIKKDSTSIPEMKVPISTSTFENLPPGNYIARIDETHIISIFISYDGIITMKEPLLDSTTVIKGGKKLSPRLKKELEIIKNKLKNN